MRKRELRSLSTFARRLLRETGGAQTLEAALFAGAVVAVSALAFSATTGSTSRAWERAAAVFRAAAPSLCDRGAPGGCGALEPDGPAAVDPVAPPPR